MNNEKKIKLSKLELAMLERDLAGEFFPPQQTKEENKALARVIEYADDLMRELNAYDELFKYEDMSSMQWLYDKYKEQQAGENNQ